MHSSMHLHGFVLSILLLSLWQVPTFATPKHYIIHLGTHHAEPCLSASPETITNSHHELISSVLASECKSSERIVYSYNKIFNAFAANLHQEEVNELAKHPSVASIVESMPLKLLTTRSVDFLGFPNQLNNYKTEDSIWVKASFGDGIIIANLDSGVWPESRSFLDQGFGPVPKKFKGVCANENDPKFKCNRKLIGARYFYKGVKEQGKYDNYTFNETLLSPRDNDDGHGTHTLSTAGGNIVPEASTKGFANGTAKGVAPRARVVAYKNAWRPTQGRPVQSNAMDLLAAFEAAVDDDVDVINVSLSQENDPTYYENNAVAVASFHAMKKGIISVASAGNNGPKQGSVQNVAPWLLTVAASTLDREFSAFLKLGNNQKIKGLRFMDSKTTDPNKVYPLISGAEARSAISNIKDATACHIGALDAAKVKGKIVVCQKSNNEAWDMDNLRGTQAEKEGAVGLVLVDDKSKGYGVTKPHLIATITISYNDGVTLFSYINSTRSPTASMSEGTTTIGVKPSPIMASFSARGPNNITKGILKPDVTAPGVNILAAYPPNVAKMPFYMIDGTSMSAPHVTGVAALVKKIHPDWSISAIKSAIMTTASPLDNEGMPIRQIDLKSDATPLAYGSGHITPNKAMDPGLVYDMTVNDYLNFICSATNQKNTTMKLYTNDTSFKCPPSFNMLDFNYPSITIPDFSGDAIVNRKLKNVGQPGTYTPKIQAPPGVSIVVEPKALVFSTMNQELGFKLTFKVDAKSLPKNHVFGSLVWADAKHVVRSPIVIQPKKV